MTVAAHARFVFLHGWGVNRCVWRPVIDLLAPEHEVYAPDLPLEGGDSATGGVDALGDMAGTIAASTPAPAVWVGWSLGGLVALQAALARPAQVVGLVLVGCTPKFVADAGWKHGVAAETMDGFHDEFRRDYACALTRFLLLQAGKTGGSRKLARRMSELISDCGHPAERALRRGLAILKDSDLRPLLPRLRVPTHVIHGRSDRLVPPAAAEFLAATIPQAHLSWVTSGHAPFITRPQEFVRLLGASRA